MKKAAEADAFEALVAAHNKFSIAYSAYTTEVDAYNKKVEAKETALAVAIAAFESFHPVKDKIAISYTKVVTKFETVDENFDPENPVCPQPILDPCQTQTLCHELMKKHFDEYVEVDTCSAKDRTVPSTRSATLPLPPLLLLPPPALLLPSSRRRSVRLALAPRLSARTVLVRLVSPASSTRP